MIQGLSVSSLCVSSRALKSFIFPQCDDYQATFPLRSEVELTRINRPTYYIIVHKCHVFNVMWYLRVHWLVGSVMVAWGTKVCWGYWEACCQGQTAMGSVSPLVLLSAIVAFACASSLTKLSHLCPVCRICTSGFCTRAKLMNHSFRDWQL